MQRATKVKGFSLGILLSVMIANAGCVGGQLGQNNSNEYRKGMVVSASEDASLVVINILKKGGNAIDAAVGVQFALAVVYPNAGNIGGVIICIYFDRTFVDV